MTSDSWKILFIAMEITCRQRPPPYPQQVQKKKKQALGLELALYIASGYARVSIMPQTFTDFFQESR